MFHVNLPGVCPTKIYTLQAAVWDFFYQRYLVKDNFWKTTPLKRPNTDPHKRYDSSNPFEKKNRIIKLGIVFQPPKKICETITLYLFMLKILHTLGFSNVCCNFVWKIQGICHRHRYRGVNGVTGYNSLPGSRILFIKFPSFPGFGELAAQMLPVGSRHPGNVQSPRKRIGNA